MRQSGRRRPWPIAETEIDQAGDELREARERRAGGDLKRPARVDLLVLQREEQQDPGPLGVAAVQVEQHLWSGAMKRRCFESEKARLSLRRCCVENNERHCFREVRHCFREVQHCLKSKEARLAALLCSEQWKAPL